MEEGVSCFAASTVAAGPVVGTHMHAGALRMPEPKHLAKSCWSVAARGAVPAVKRGH